MIIKNFQFVFVIIILVSMAVAPAIALGAENKNLLLIVVMSISPIIVLLYEKFDNNDVLLLMFMASIIIFPLVFHPESMRWSTVLYTCMFCLTFIGYKRLLETSGLTLLKYRLLLKYLIYAYFGVLVIQQFCVLTGLPIFNVSNYIPNTPWKLNSLASEPSHSARIVAILMYCYIVATEIRTGKEYNLKNEFKLDKWLWIAFFYTMLTMGSGAAFLFLGIVLLKFIKFKDLIPISVILIVLLTLSTYVENAALERTIKTVKATTTLNEAAIIKADHSASFRIVPMIVLAKMFDLTSMDGWFGHGIDHVSTFMYKKIPAAYKGMSGGGMFQLMTEYGFISFLLLCWFSIVISFQKEYALNMVFWFLIFFMNSINSQIVWLCLFLFFTNKFFINKNKYAIK